MQLKLRFSKRSQHWNMIMALRYGKPLFKFDWIYHYVLYSGQYTGLKANALEQYQMVLHIWRSRI